MGRAAFAGPGVKASTNALAGRRYGVPVRARQPASYILASKSETAALEGWLRATTDQPVLRVDVREAIAGIDRAVTAARSRATASWSDAPIVIELSADVVVEAAPIAAEKFAKAGLKEPVLVVRGADAPGRIAELRASNVPIAAYVVECPAVHPGGARYDVVAVEEGGQWALRMRLAPMSAESTAPGRKVVMRYFDADGHPVGDVCHGTSERHLPAKDARLFDVRTGYTTRLVDAATNAPLLAKMMRAGKRMNAIAPARESRERAIRGVRALSPRQRRVMAPAMYPCGITLGLAATRDELAEKLRER